MRVVSVSGMEAQLMDASDPEDRAAWVSLWQRSRFRRPHDHPSYLEATGAAGERSMAIACLAGHDLLSLYPFNVLDLAQLPFARHACAAPGVDVISPYGYGGATCEDDCRREQAEQAMHQALACYFLQLGVVSEFVREDLFRHHLISRSDGIHTVMQPNIVVDLTVSPEERWQRYSPNMRRYLRHAQEAGITVDISDGSEWLEPFIDLYYGTMKRQHASDYYFFSRGKLQHLHDALNCADGVRCVLASLNGQAISAQLLLMSADTMYSFLSGTDQTFFKLRPFEWLNHNVISWGHDNGYTAFVLGGGLKPNDGLFQFKRKFEPNGLVDFCVRRVIWNQERYDALVAARQAWEMGVGKTWMPEPTFFPRYRAPSVPEPAASPSAA